MTDYAKAVQADQRLCVLRTLEDSQASRANEGVLQASLQMYGHSLTRDQVSSLTEWLKENGLVTLETLGEGIRIVKLTERGEDVALGKIKQPGVRKPRLS